MRTIKHTIKMEHMVSRIPGLFAYIENNEFGVNELHSATDSLMGCYGKVIENMKLPDNVENSIEITKRTLNGETRSFNILTNDDKIYSYRTLISYYYQYKDQLKEKAPNFIEFVEKGIGIVKVEGVDFNKCAACPEYIYLANLHSIYNYMMRLEKKCNFYNNRKDIDNTVSDLCCKCEKFDNMGGSEFIAFLEKQMPLAENRANEYMQYAKNARDAKKSLSININISLISSINDMGIMTPYIDEYEFGKKYFKGDVVAKLNNGVWETYTCTEDTSGEWDETYMMLKFPENQFHLQQDVPYENTDKKNIKIEGECASLLKSLRRINDYLNIFDETETPSFGRDWLYYYRKGLVVNYRTLKDDMGNILCFGGKMPSVEVGQMVTDLYAYGDVITNIEVISDTNKIRFTYYLDAHLKARLKKIEEDDEKNKLYLYDKFEYDQPSTNGIEYGNEPVTNGIQYVEEYPYEYNGELYKLINDGLFDDYVNGNMDFGRDGEYDPYKKYEFITSNNQLQYKKQILHLNTIVNFTNAKFRVVIPKHRDVQQVKLFRNEYYQGVSYRPTEEIDVKINRGFATAFEKHIKFSEVNTLQDMKEYSNSSFFVFKEN